MRCISIWSPWANLVIAGHKSIETRSWAAPKNLIGQTIGIASTKIITPGQRSAMSEPRFVKHYEKTGMPPIEELPLGFLIGTAFLHSCDFMTEDDIEDITDEELAFGWYEPGRYAWRFRYPRAFARPIAIRGAQGIWSYDGPRIYEVH